MAFRHAALAVSLLFLTACRQQPLSLPIAHADEKETVSVPPPAPEQIVHSNPGDSCYAFMEQRPKEQRAAAVQIRLRQFDHMAAALDSRTFTVDLTGDHANVLVLRFPTVWPASQAYSDKVSEVVEEYFSSPEVMDNVCNSGFSEVRLVARGKRDHQQHLIWKARVTFEGLVKDEPAPVETAGGGGPNSAVLR